MAPEFAHEPDAHRYTLRIGDELVCIADYSQRPGQVYFTHTYTSPARRGHGHAASLVEFAVNDIASRTTDRIVPVCSFVVKYLRNTVVPGLDVSWRPTADDAGSDRVDAADA